MSAWGAARWVCVCVVWITDVGFRGKRFWWSKTYINGEQVGQLTLSGTNLSSWAHWRKNYSWRLSECSEYTYIQTYTAFSMLHLHSRNLIIFALCSHIPEVQCGLRTLEDTNLGFSPRARLQRLHHHTLNRCWLCETYYKPVYGFFFHTGWVLTEF